MAIRTVEIKLVRVGEHTLPAPDRLVKEMGSGMSLWFRAYRIYFPNLHPRDLAQSASKWQAFPVDGFLILPDVHVLVDTGFAVYSPMNTRLHAPQTNNPLTTIDIQTRMAVLGARATDPPVSVVVELRNDSDKPTTLKYGDMVTTAHLYEELRVGFTTHPESVE